MKMIAPMFLSLALLAEGSYALLEHGRTGYMKFLDDYQKEYGLSSADVALIFSKEEITPQKQFVSSMAHFLYYGDVNGACSTLETVNAMTFSTNAAMRQWASELFLSCGDFKAVGAIHADVRCAYEKNRNAKRECYYYKGVAQYEISDTKAAPKEFTYIKGYYNVIDEITSKDKR